MNRLNAALAALLAIVAVSALAHAQQAINANPVTIQTQYSLVPISATTAVNNQTTLTIPAPPPAFYNYICGIHLNLSQDGTGTVGTNITTSTTNFNAWAMKLSSALTVNGNYDIIESWGIANVGCAKSTAPGTATTFVSPTALLHTAFTWTASYYQAP